MPNLLLFFFISNTSTEYYLPNFNSKHEFKSINLAQNIRFFLFCLFKRDLNKINWNVFFLKYFRFIQPENIF